MRLAEDLLAGAVEDDVDGGPAAGLEGVCEVKFRGEGQWGVDDFVDLRGDEVRLVWGGARGADPWPVVVVGVVVCWEEGGGAEELNGLRGDFAVWGVGDEDAESVPFVGVVGVEACVFEEGLPGCEGGERDGGCFGRVDVFGLEGDFVV